MMLIWLMSRIMLDREVADVGKSQQVKGKVGEREVVKLIESFGFMARRGQVWNGEPDIICPELPVHFEIKRHEELHITEWFKQAAKDCGDKYPSVVYRQSRKPWMITLRVTDFLELTTGSTPIDGLTRLTMKFDEFMAIMKELFNE